MVDPEARLTHPVQYLSAYFEKRLAVGDFDEFCVG